MRVFHQNESCLSCLHPPSSYEGRREQGRQLSFWWKTLNLIGHYGTLLLCKYPSIDAVYQATLLRVLEPLFAKIRPPTHAKSNFENSRQTTISACFIVSLLFFLHWTTQEGKFSTCRKQNFWFFCLNQPETITKKRKSPLAWIRVFFSESQFGSRHPGHVRQP